MTSGFLSQVAACGLALAIAAAASAGRAGEVRAAPAQLRVIPAPQQLSIERGTFALRDGMKLSAPRDAREQWIANFLRRHVQAATGVGLKVVEGVHSAPIQLEIDPAVEGKDAYQLTVTSKNIILAAHDDRGLFWGVQTLRQLLPLQRDASPTIPAVRIEDAPRYQWRGMMLDVSRHFYPVSFIKQQIRLMSYYKLNVFHWHLTDDQGWRIQIPKYPKLTSVGAWRTDAEGRRYGGFYTDQQIRDVVAYAKERGVMVVPEIEMPGHTSAAIAAYPQLSCDDGARVQVADVRGVLRSADCVGKASTYKFLEDVLDEVIKLFPSPYIHIGGDEVPPGVWADCTACAQLAKAHGFKDDEAGLHSYFVRRFQQYLAGKGKTLIGWSEIMEGGMDPNAIVEEWLGPEGTAKTLQNGNHIIVAGPFYLNRPADWMTLQDLYRNDPFEQPFYQEHPKLVLGGEAALWGEHATPLNANALLYPRLLAVSEHLWNPSAHDWQDFHARVLAQEAWLFSQHVAYGPANKNIVDYRVSFNPTYQRWRIRAARGFGDVRLHYTLDGSQPTAKSPAFGDVLDLYEPATVTVAPFRGDVQYHVSRTFQLVKNLAWGDPVTFAVPPSRRLSCDTGCLTDGVLGNPTVNLGPDLRDGSWDGWHGVDMDATIDLGHAVTVHGITARFLEWSALKILPPATVSFEASSDGTSWRTLMTIALNPKPDAARAFVAPVAYAAATPLTSRYLRVVATPAGQVSATEKATQPAVAGGDGQAGAWIVSDEIIVK